MNPTENDESSDLERRLSRLALLEPSANYVNIPCDLEKAPTGRYWGNWKAITVYSSALLLISAVIFDLVPLSKIGNDPDRGMVEVTQKSTADVIATTLNSESDHRYILGTHYKEFVTSQTSTQALSEIKIAFSYPCFPCYQFDQLVSEQLNSGQTQIRFSYVPVTWNETTREYARIFYTAETLDIQDRIHSELFKLLHQDNEVIGDQAFLTRFFGNFGISQERFISAFNSNVTLSRVREAEAFNQKYDVQTAPTLIVDCRYIVTPNINVGHQDMFRIAHYLIDSHQAEYKQLC